MANTFVPTYQVVAAAQHANVTSHLTGTLQRNSGPFLKNDIVSIEGHTSASHGYRFCRGTGGAAGRGPAWIPAADIQ